MTEPRENMREWRLFRGISQAELARRMDITKSEISRLEGGQRRLTVDWLQKVADGLQIKREQLFEAPPVYRTMEERINASMARTATTEFGIQPAVPGVELVIVEGDEMADTLAPGDAVIVDRNRRVPSPSGIFVMIQGGSRIVRRLQMTSESSVRVSCDNRVYGPVDVGLAEVEIVGRVVGRVTRM